MEAMQTTEPEMTYEEAVEKLKGIGLHSHEIRIYSSRWGSQTIEMYNLDDARTLALALVEAARELHGERWISHRPYGHDTLDEVLTNEEMWDRHYWMVSVWDVLPRAKWHEDAVDPSRTEFIFGHRCGAYRMANPESKVFLSTGGRDCDGYRWAQVHEYRTLLEAHEDLESSYEWADGPMGWSVITQDQFETFDGFGGW